MEIEAELSLRKENAAYMAELRAKPGEDSELRFGPFFVVVDARELADLEDDPERYGQAISDALFQEDGLVWALGQTYGMARGQNANLRLRLFIDRSAAELDELRWELLRLPGTTDCLSACDDIFFSRYAPVRRETPPPKTRASLRALAVVSSPADLQSRYNLVPLGFSLTKTVLEEAVGHVAGGQVPGGESEGGMMLDFVPGEGEHATLELLARRAAACDVLVLAAHSKQTAKGYSLLLQDASGKARAVPIEKLAARLQSLRSLPRLLVLLSDHSAGAVAALVAGLGIPAVVAIHGRMDTEQARQFLIALFAALREDGAIDRAVASARRVVAESVGESADEACEDFAPALFMSLHSGALWRNALVPATDLPGAKVHPLPEEAAPSAPDRGALYSVLSSPAFSLDELEELCFFLRVEWDALRGQTQPAKARALVKYLEGRDRLGDLAAEIRKARPGLKI